jgi:hypothetical protein
VSCRQSDHYTEKPLPCEQASGVDRQDHLSDLAGEKTFEQAAEIWTARARKNRSAHKKAGNSPCKSTQNHSNVYIGLSGQLPAAWSLPTDPGSPCSATDEPCEPASGAEPADLDTNERYIRKGQDISNTYPPHSRFQETANHS